MEFGSCLKGEDLVNQIGRKLKIARELVSLSVEKVASAVKISPEDIVEYEFGQKLISVGLLEQLAVLYGQSLEYFLGDGKVQKAIFSDFSRLSEEDMPMVFEALCFARNLNEMENRLINQ